jgi:flagellar protein FlaG
MEATMSVNTGEIQPIASKPWIVPDATRKETQVIPPVAKAEGGMTKGVGEDNTDSRDKFAPVSDPKVDAQVAEQIKSFLQETADVELNFHKDESGKMVVRVLDRSTGKVVRQIPPENLVKVRDKLEELRGILFDGKA